MVLEISGFINPKDKHNELKETEITVLVEIKAKWGYIQK